MGNQAPGLVTPETVDLVRQLMADTTRDAAITAFSGLTGYELEAPAKVINPVITPLVNMIPRKMGRGNDICHWKAITSFGEQSVTGALDGDAMPDAVSYTIASLSNPYNTIALSDSVNFQAQWRGRSLEGDVRARRVAELLYALKMREESWIIQMSQKLMTPPRVLIQQTAATGGHASDATTYWVQVTPVNANGEGLPSAFASFTTPANTGANTGNLVITLFTVPNATYYNVYVGSGSTQPTNGNMWIQSAISGAVNAVQPGQNASVSLTGGGSTISGRVFGPTLTLTLTAVIATSAVANPPATNTAVVKKDANSNILTWDGLIAQALNNTSTANGYTLGAQVGVPAASNGVLALGDLNSLLMSAYVQAGADPDVIVLNPVTHNKLTNLVVASGQTRYVVEANQPDVSGRLVAQYRVTHFLNQATGKEIPIIPDLYCPLDTIIAFPMTFSFPVPEISDGNALEIETNREYWGVDFAVTGSSYKFADYVDEAFKVYYLGGLCVLRGITPAV
jgi:hypothetical protein